MTELHVISRLNRHLYEDELEQSFRLRHEIYVNERQWTTLYRSDGREIDQFDNENTSYLLAIDKGEVVGGHRFHPTTFPTLLSEVFPHTCMRSPRRGQDVFETTRIFVAKHRRGGQPEPRVESLILAGTLEYALALRISELQFLMETWWIPRLASVGWNIRPLGAPTDIDGMSCLAVSLEVTDEVWRSTCRTRRVDGPILTWRGIRVDATNYALEGVQ